MSVCRGCGCDVLLLGMGYAVFALAFRLGIDVAQALAALMAPVAVAAAARGWRAIHGLLLPKPRLVAVGLVSALALYAVFAAGRAVSEALGMLGDVRRVYELVSVGPATPAVLLAVAVAEEVYWRGWLQSAVLAGARQPWLLSSILYALAHVASGIAILVPAALAAGVVLGLTAHRAGLAAAILAHYAWLILAFHVAPYA